ncbi:MAG: hypothetical protein AUF76_06745 [Acidobacteria bacterium 13_1_20CM_2_65_9]|nr:MAG: hypothetical protein AUF76_06745 [Acidobacteria bacterium 13_1_20CM_2_65_9]
MWHDVRLALRSARRAPGVALACALTLAVGAGAATAVLALLNGVVLKPLPVERPRELVLFSDDPTNGVFTGTPHGTLILFSTPSFEYLRAQQHTLGDVAAFQTGGERLAARIDGSAELADVRRVSGNYFAVLGVRAQAGRLFAATDDRAGAPPVVVISDAHWDRRFQRDATVIGRSVILRTTPCTIVGVAARGFYGESMRVAPDFWMPIAITSGSQTAGYDEHHTWWLGLIGRLKPSVTMTQAGVDVNARLQEFLIDEAGSAVSPERRDEIAHTNIALARGDLGRSAIRARAITPLTLLFVLVVLLLVTASINVASLLIARATARDRVTLIHLMLGANRSRLVWIALVETLAIVLPGLLAGISVALASPRALLPLLTAAPLPIDFSSDGARRVAGTRDARGRRERAAPRRRGCDRWHGGRGGDREGRDVAALRRQPGGLDGAGWRRRRDDDCCAGGESRPGDAGEPGRSNRGVACRVSETPYLVLGKRMWPKSAASAI